MAGKQSIEGTRLNAFGVDPDDLVIIGYDTDDGPEHPLYDERAKLPVSEEMVVDIMGQGVLLYVLVRKNGDAVEVSDGRQRVKATREANKRRKKDGLEPILVPCVVKKGDDATMMGIGIAANELRQDDPLSIKAAKLQRYLATGRNEKDAAIRFGVTLQTIKNWGRLSDLDPKVVKAIEEGRIPASAGYALADLSRDEQKTELEKYGNGHTSVRTVKAGAKSAKSRRRGEQTDFEPPGKRVINKVLRLNEKQDVLNGDFLRGVRWVLGDLNPTQVKGLTDLVREAKGEKEAE